MEDEDRELTRKLARRRCWWPLQTVSVCGGRKKFRGENGR